MKYILNEYAQAAPDGDVRCEVLQVLDGPLPVRQAVSVEPLKDADLTALRVANGGTVWGNVELCEALSAQLGVTVELPVAEEKSE